jgi:hypothetical protein
MVLVAPALCPQLAAAQDSVQVARLEQEVRQLQREVLNLSQLVSELRTRVERSAYATAPPAPVPPRATNESTRAAAANQADARWVDAGQWRQLRPGMSELEIIELLGPPTSMRAQDGERVLLYALEIGNSGFLAGSVTLRDRAAVSIETPTLK